MHHVYFALFAVLLCLSAFFSGVEVVFVSLSRLRIKAMMKRGVRGAEAVYRLKKKQPRLITAILIGNNVVNITAAAIATYIAMGIFGETGVGLAAGATTFILLVFGEITPKNIASRYAQEIAPLVAAPLEILILLMLPLIIFFEMITNFLMRLLGAKRESPVITEEYLRAMFEIGVDEAVLEPAEREYFERILKFNDIKVSGVMVQKQNIFSLPESMSVFEAAKAVSKNSHSRIPVFSRRGRISGVVHTKDLLNEFGAGSAEKKLSEIAQKPLFVRSDVMLDDLFRHFQRRHVHLAIVLDGKNSVCGLVTLEDLLEEILGEIYDEKEVPKSR
ncbi:hypothetical protein COV61_04265 [Candidatus Micrarchaeota archaeon CG11_big_fil_rev_8_21_14_0_20_47_5]|nr:MAG: hypothetical protein AUJ17_00460 [Candidatus Micrarchaeota archaeon CG1_02_47_40]PIN83034.1 MAG: hypothetical protein COV61_04265 [Candidatus Micrarchaeota archaeon CG11_big_fil_rev_8_21_14_0_20_47_5]